MTTKRDQYRKVLEAGLNGNFDEADRLNAEVGDIPFTDSAVLVGATFYMATQLRFSEDPSHTAIKAFAKDALAEYGNAEPPLKPMTVEALLRAALGEEELMRGIDATEAVPVQMSLVYKMVSDLSMSSEDIAELLDNSEELAEAWSS